MSPPPDPASWVWRQVVSVPRVDGAADPQGWMVAGVTPALAAAHADLRSDLGPASEEDRTTAGRRDERPPQLAVAWVRLPASTDVRVVVGGTPVPALDGDRAVPQSWTATDADRRSRDPAETAPPDRPGIPLLWPPGATAVPVDGAAVGRWWDALPRWVACRGTVAVGDPPAPPPVGGDLPSPGWDDYLTHLAGPFGWVVVAEPLPPSVAEEELVALAADLTSLRRRESEADRLEVDLGQRRLRQLARARGDGLWQVRVLAGGLTTGEARRAAALLCASCDPVRSGVRLVPGETAGTLARAWGVRPDEDHGGLRDAVGGDLEARSPFHAGTSELAWLVRPPVREHPGLYLAAPHRFDVTPQRPPGDAFDDGAPDDRRAAARAAALGDVLDEALRPVGAFTVPHDTLNRHAFVCGATGSGKSQTARRLLESLATGPRPVPWLVVEPAKAEYAGMAGRLRPDGRVLVIRPGDLDVPPASLNPLEPQPGFPLQSHVDLVRALFVAAFQAEEPFPQVLSRALTVCYAEAGWNLVTSSWRRPVKPKLLVDEPDRPARPRYPTLRDLQAVSRRVVERIGYGPEVTANIRGFMDVRVGSLREGAPGRFFEGGHPLDVPALLQRNTVLELDSITNDQDKAFVIGAVLVSVVEHLRVRERWSPGRREGLDHLLLIEEAHRLLRNLAEGPVAASVELFASLLAEIRAYGEGVVVVEQIPSKIVPDVTKNSALKVMHRLPALDDREFVGTTMNLQSDQSEAVVALPPGVAAVTTDGADRPLLVRVTGGERREDAGGAEVVPPLAGRRSPRCGRECEARACTLAEMAAADDVAAQPLLLVWAETVAAALVVGPPLDVPGPLAAVRRLWPSEVRTRECAAAVLADRASEARRAHLGGQVDPDDFAENTRDTLAALLAGRPPPATDRRRWRAGVYRWREQERELRAAVERAGGVDAARAHTRHPESEEWARLGLVLDGESLGEQLDQLRRYLGHGTGGGEAVVGDTGWSGLGRAIAEVGGAVDRGGVSRALRLAASSPTLEVLAEHMSGVVVDGR